MATGSLIATGARVVLVHPSSDDAAEFLRMEKQSRLLHGAWTRLPSCQSQFDEYIANLDSPAFFGSFVADKLTRELIGVCNASQIVLGCFRSCYLGYYVNATHARNGFMFEGISLLLTHLFSNMGLHRAEANIQPENEASISLVRKLGFELEGYSKNYLQIAGEWRDHERWAIRSEMWQEAKTPGLLARPTE